ncbi:MULTISPECIES: holo-ACP synthase [Paenibacillus]|uniref:holo-ACP synthase n=1 Tax=Paenibacillus TaxID=44249 RepID=UPI0022B8C8DB|nr:holo-ACP synthase [Paenibacillus caseinilyticus]MCZ8523881.1 holo-ACP synthase [Paenibacillus caseinilyticus]
MIIGIGTDLLDIARVRSILEQPAGERFLQRVLTPAERELAAARRGRLAEFTAGRFAAKEAVVKALGCGIGKEVGLHDIEVLPDAKGKPHCRLSEAALQRLAEGGTDVRGLIVHLSITHSDTAAMAYAMAERRG